MPYVKPASLDSLVHTVIGAGTLGRRIALMWITDGGHVNLFDSNPKALDDAKAYVEETLPSVLDSIVPNARKPGKLSLFTDRKEALKNAWLVTEAIPEILQAKIDLLGDLDSTTSDDVIIATNSSSFTASELMSKVTKKDRIVNTHYYMPPRSLPVEIMGNKYTDPEINKLLLQETAKHGFHPFNVKKESIGLIANRIWAAIKRECLYVAAEGVAEPGEIDRLLKLALGFPNPPFATMDRVGLDVVRDIERHYQQTRTGLPKEVLTYLDKYIADNKLGEKTGEGFFKHPPHKPHAQDHLIYLDIIKGQVRSMTVSGTENKVLVDGLTTMPDGVQLDKDGAIYYTNMGAKPTNNDGSITKVSPAGDGREQIVETIVASGKTHTPKQLHLDQAGKKLYWSDREGGRVQRSNLDGSQLETLYDSAPGKPRPLADSKDWCVGITVDHKTKLIYWTQKGGSKAWAGKILRANIEIPAGQTAEAREDIEVLLDNLPEPIDLEIEEDERVLFWTDRGDPPFGNSLNKFDVSAPLDPARVPQGPDAKLVIAERFHEAIGLTLDRKNRKIYVSDLLGSVYVTDYDGSNKRVLVADQGNFSGIAFVAA